MSMFYQLPKTLQQQIKSLITTDFIGAKAIYDDWLASQPQ